MEEEVGPKDLFIDTLDEDVGEEVEEEEVEEVEEEEEEEDNFFVDANKRFVCSLPN